MQQIPSPPESSFLEIYCAIHFSTEWEAFFPLRGFVALSTIVLPNQCKGTWDSCAKMLIHLAVEGNRTSWAGQTPRTVSYTVSNFLFIRPCWKCIISSTNVLLWKRWEELYKRLFAMPGAICPNIRNPTFRLLKSSVYFYSLFSHFLPVHCHILLSWVFLSCCLLLVLFSQKKKKAVKQNSHFTQQTLLVHQLNMRSSWLLQKKRKRIETAHCYILPWDQNQNTCK